MAGSVVALLLPLAGLMLLLGVPRLDLLWGHQPAHFWMVLSAAMLSAVVAYGTGTAAQRRGDARVLFVSLAFLSSAGFLGLHALATPQVLLDTPNAGFTLATPVGIAIGSAFALVSTEKFEGEAGVRAMRQGRCSSRAARVDGPVGGVVVGRAAADDRHTAPEQTSGPMVAMALAAITLYGWMLGRYLRLWRHRGGLMPLAMAGAFVLLAEAMVVLVFSRAWHRAGGSGTCSCWWPSGWWPGVPSSSGTRSASPTSTSTRPSRAAAR